jgi:hypothetical protein
MACSPPFVPRPCNAQEVVKQFDLYAGSVEAAEHGHLRDMAAHLCHTGQRPSDAAFGLSVEREGGVGAAVQIVKIKFVNPVKPGCGRARGGGS